MSKFSVDRRLLADCHLLGHLRLSALLLHRNAQLPWFILVPEVNVIELYELERNQQLQLMAEVNEVSRSIKQHFKSDKINVGAIGNIVSQLHVHVIGRKIGDCCWPGVAWGNLRTSRSYSENEVSEILDLFKTELDLKAVNLQRADEQ